MKVTPSKEVLVPTFEIVSNPIFGYRCRVCGKWQLLRKKKGTRKQLECESCGSVIAFYGRLNEKRVQVAVSGCLVVKDEVKL